MNYGKFFRLDNEKSDLSSGIACYDYIWLCDNENSSKYLVYLTINKDSIDFHAHYYDINKEKHSHNTILSLPLSANLDVKDGLTEALVEGWETNFPRYAKRGSNYLFKILLRTILNQKTAQTGYSSLVTFGENNKNIFRIFFEKLQLDYKIDKYHYKDLKKVIKIAYKPNKFKFNRFIRQLILDFMFDLEHTKVFQTSPHYEHISVKLKENYFFSSLAAKANFYYWRDIITQEKENRTDSLTNQLSVYIEYYLKAEKQWTKSIRSPKAQANFNDFKDKWFCDPEEEMAEVYGKKFIKVDKIVKSYKNKQQKEEIKKSRELSSKWRVWHYEWSWKLWRNEDFQGWHLIFPKLILSVLAAWVTIIIGSSSLFPLAGIDLSSGIVEKGVPYWVTFIMTIIFTIHAVIFYSIRRRSPNLLKDDRLKKYLKLFFIRPLKILFISFVFSLFFGFILSTMFSAFNIIPIHPNPFFWSCVFLAMFIGVVLQQVTEEKYTEE